MLAFGALTLLKKKKKTFWGGSHHSQNWWEKLTMPQLFAQIIWVILNTCFSSGNLTFGCMPGMEMSTWWAPIKNPGTKSLISSLGWQHFIYGITVHRWGNRKQKRKLNLSQKSQIDTTSIKAMLALSLRSHANRPYSWYDVMELALYLYSFS